MQAVRFQIVLSIFFSYYFLFYAFHFTKAGFFLASIERDLKIQINILKITIFIKSQTCGLLVAKDWTVLLDMIHADLTDYYYCIEVNPHRVHNICIFQLQYALLRNVSALL